MTADPSTSALELELQRLTAGALSPLARYGHVALLLAATLMSVLLAALLATEPALAIPLGTVKSRLFRARHLLRQRLEALENHHDR